MATITYGNVKKPPVMLRLIPDEQNGAWDYLGPRVPVGIVSHTEVGFNDGTDKWFRRGASSTGLTDFGIARDGTIYQWNDPWGKEHWVKIRVRSDGWTIYDDSGRVARVSPNRAGWANGGSDGLEGDGPLYVRTRGINAINRDLVSIEREDRGLPFTEPFDGRQFEAFCRLVAWVYDQIKVPWDRFPINPNLEVAIVTYFFHLEFATKGCPWGPVTSIIDQTQNTIRSLLKAGQTATSVPAPTEPATPVEPDHDWLPEGYTLEGLDARFGSLVRKRLDGSVSTGGFNIKGPISNAWIARGAAEKRPMSDLPPASYMVETIEPRILIGEQPAVSSIVLFDGRGSDNWVLFRPDSQIGWKWVV